MSNRFTVATTERLNIVNHEFQDVALQKAFEDLYPELEQLDPHIGEFLGPVFFTIFPKGGRQQIGVCCLYNINSDDIELGIRIYDPSCWNQGLGVEAVNALCEYASIMYPFIKDVVLKTPITNIRAQKCYLKCGFLPYKQAVVSGFDVVYMKKAVR